MLEIIQKYRNFAAFEANGRSPLYVTFATAITQDQEMLSFIAALPPTKRHPHLLLGAMQYLFGAAPDWRQFRERLLSHRRDVEEIILTHTIQTNEPARCTTLLPVLAQLPQPVALIEVGASAGLCLLADRYTYRFNERLLAPKVPPDEPPLFECRINAAVVVPGDLPKIAWRAGLDLNPLDPSDPETTRWLEALVWPGQDRRLRNLRRALKIAAAERPRVVRGDLREDLPAIAAQAPTGLPLVVFHTAVLVYVSSAEDRNAFTQTLRELNALWICNETPGLYPDFARQLPRARPRTHGMMLIAMNAQPLAWADPHGASLEWIEGRQVSTAWG
jgi:hypothetical protein